MGQSGERVTSPQVPGSQVSQLQVPLLHDILQLAEQPLQLPSVQPGVQSCGLLSSGSTVSPPFIWLAAGWVLKLFTESFCRLSFDFFISVFF